MIDLSFSPKNIWLAIFFWMLSPAFSYAELTQIISLGAESSNHGKRSSINTRLEVSENKNLEDESTYQPVAKVFVDGEHVGTLVGAETPQQPLALIQIVELDSSNPHPEVLLSSFTFGAHCCRETKILTSDVTGKQWVEVSLGYFDGSPIEATDPLKKSQYIIHTYDNRFLYRFGCYACSAAPSIILQLIGTEFHNVTRKPQYLSIHKENLRDMEERLNDALKEDPNGFLAGYVANKALVGELWSGWRIMLKNYNIDTDWGLKECEEGVDANGNCKGEEITYDFPAALKKFSTETGYITTAEAESLASIKIDN